MQYRVLSLPGWQGSGPEHWQSRWEALHGDERVEQNDWLWPRRGDWMARLDEVVLASSLPTVLVAHSLGCHLVASWSAHSKHVPRIAAAMLVAPPDTERSTVPPQLFNWRPISRARLHFTSLVVYSEDDVYCSTSRAEEFAGCWGAGTLAAGPMGHINTESALGEWTQGRQWLSSLLASLDQPLDQPYSPNYCS